MATIGKNYSLHPLGYQNSIISRVKSILNFRRTHVKEALWKEASPFSQASNIVNIARVVLFLHRPYQGVIMHHTRNQPIN